MVLAQLVPGSFVNENEATLQADCDYDWQSDNHNYADHLIGEIPLVKTSTSFQTCFKTLRQWMNLKSYRRHFVTLSHEIKNRTM